VKKFFYKTWSGRTKEVEADYIEFQSGHVAFYKDVPNTLLGSYRLVLAVNNADVGTVWPEDESDPSDPPAPPIGTVPK
jgi:hypothetical protein